MIDQFQNMHTHTLVIVSLVVLNMLYHTPSVLLANLKNRSYEGGELLLPRWKVGSSDW
jgi:hypothetical protein